MTENPSAEPEIEITPEMIEAAWLALRKFELVWEYASPESIEAALRAALRVQRRPGEPRR